MKLSKIYLLGYGVLALIALGVIGVLVYRAYSFDQRIRDEERASLGPISASLVINFGGENIASFVAEEINQPATILSLLQMLSSQEKFSLNLESKPMGTLIKSVDGFVAENGNFWFTYLNGNLVSGGVESQKLNDGDRVELQYKTL